MNIKPLLITGEDFISSPVLKDQANFRGDCKVLWDMPFKTLLPR
jgi:hypothetical protein